MKGDSYADLYEQTREYPERCPDCGANLVKGEPCQETCPRRNPLGKDEQSY